MAQYDGMVLTNDGINLLAKCQLGQKIEFTKVLIGDGRVPEGKTFQEMTALVNTKLALGIQNVDFVEDGRVDVTAIIDNSGLEVGFFVREIGLFAKQVGGADVLYAYTNAGDLVDYLPNAKVNEVTDQIVVQSIITNKENVVINLNDNFVVATKADLKKHDESTDAHINLMAAHNEDGSAHEPAFTAHNADTNAHENLFQTVEFNVNCNSESPIEDGTIENPFKTIMGCINAIPKWCKNVDIHVAKGTYAEDVVLNNPNICVTIQGNPLDRTDVKIKSITMNVDRLTLLHLTVYDIYDIVNGKHGIRAGACNYFYVNYCKVENTNKHEDVYGICAFGCTAQLEHNIVDGYKYGIAAAYGASVMTYENQISNASAGLYANMGTIYDLSNNVFIDCTNNFECFSGTVVTNTDVYVNTSDGSTKGINRDVASNATPAGTMQMFAGNTIPAGWLLCDGSAVSRTNYAKLFSAIGTIYGKGDNRTTFALPNLINLFVQGATTAGIYKGAGLPNITGSVDTGGEYKSDHFANGAFTKSSAGTHRNEGGSSGCVRISINASRCSNIYGASTTVQPPALTMLPIIKY